MNDLTPDEMSLLILAIDAFFTAHVETNFFSGHPSTFCSCCYEVLHRRKATYSGHKESCEVKRLEAVRKRLVEAKAHANDMERRR